MFAVGYYVMQVNREKAQLLPRIYPPFGILGVVDRISYAGCSIQWQGEQWKHTMYTYPESDLIYIGIPNQYGYRYNINHPVVAVYYQRYKEKHHLHCCFPLSDKQRWEFERGMDRLLLNGRHRPEEIFR